MRRGERWKRGYHEELEWSWQFCRIPQPSLEECREQGRGEGGEEDMGEGRKEGREKGKEEGDFSGMGSSCTESGLVPGGGSATYPRVGSSFSAGMRSSLSPGMGSSLSPYRGGWRGVGGKERNTFSASPLSMYYVKALRPARGRELTPSPNATRSSSPRINAPLRMAASARRRVDLRSSSCPPLFPPPVVRRSFFHGFCQQALPFLQPNDAQLAAADEARFEACALILRREQMICEMKQLLPWPQSEGEQVGGAGRRWSDPHDVCVVSGHVSQRTFCKDHKNTMR